MAILSQARIHISFHRFTEISQIFHNKYIFNSKKQRLRKPSKGGLQGVKIQNIFWGSLLPDPPRSLRLWHSFRKLVSIYPRSAPVSCGGVLYWYSSTGILLLKTGQSYHLPFLFLFKENSMKTKDLLTDRTGQPFSPAILVIMLSDP